MALVVPHAPLAAEVPKPANPLTYVKLAPKCGLKVSRICLGMMSYGSKQWRNWILEKAEAKPFIARALELGINFFDTADIYSVGRSEEILGECLEELKADREQIVIATKVRMDMGGQNKGGLSRKHIMHSIDNSLKRLRTSYVDLYQIHRFDPETPIEETMEALHDCVKSGKVRYIGASSMYAWQFAKMQSVAAARGWTQFVTMQNHYNLVYREEEREMNPLCVDSGVGLIPWSPLARGFLCGTRSVLDKEFALAAEAKAAAAKAQAATAAAVIGTGAGAAAAPAAAAGAGAGAKSAVDAKAEADAKEAKVAAALKATEGKAPSTARITSDPFAQAMYYNPSDWKIVERVVELAAKKGKPAAQLALAWILSKPGVVSPIIGATKMLHLDDAIAALSLKLDADEIKFLEELYQPHPILGH